MSEKVTTPPSPPRTAAATTNASEKPTVDQGEAASSTVSQSPERGRGRGGRRGWGRGRGRGRGRARGRTPNPAQDQDREGGTAKEAEPSAPAAVPQEGKEKAPDVDDTEAAPEDGGPSGGGKARRRPQREWKERPPRPSLTHFLAIPLGHNPAFREKLSAFTNALLAADPAIPGLDSTIIMPARRMHFTLGVMSLHRPSPTDPDAPVRTLEEATKVLQDLKPKILTMLNGERLRVSLDSMDIMKPERGDQKRAHVMWVGPAGGDSTERLMAVGKLIKQTFEEAGLLIDENRPLKLHCTVVNTIYRKPRPRFRQPFSYPSILTSEAVESVLVQDEIVDATEADKTLKKGPIKVDLGEWDIDEVQICEMGSWGPEGEYRAVARCPLV
ncbi:AKAP7 2'5' RNA ligase-like domain-containing protein [Cerioporus squamosus]|nr:AKAP7 2'5' RNA ligase-like domain-containing protein [Cerioporus squamosus]